MLSFTLPCPPSANNLFANVAGRGRVRSKDYRIWANAAMWDMKLQDGKPRTWETITGPVAVSIITGNHRADLDNQNKALLDLMVDMKVIGDDRNVEELKIVRGTPSKTVSVTVRALSESYGSAAA